MPGSRTTLPLIGCVLAVASTGAARQAPAPTSFSIFLQGRIIGIEQVTVSTDEQGHVIGGTARIAPPLDVALKKVQIRYNPDWTPRDAEIEGTVRSQPTTIKTTFAGGKATSLITQSQNETTDSDQVSPDTLVLPTLVGNSDAAGVFHSVLNGFFGSYEALAARLRTMQPGGSVRAYVMPQAEIAVRFTATAEEKVQLSGRAITVKRHDLVFENPGGPLNASLYTDETGRFVRLHIPAQTLEVMRSDLASVAARRETISHPGDEPVRIPANGFTLAATATRPLDTARGSRPLDTAGGSRPKAPQRWPAVVLIGGSGPVDRDETVAGIPIMGQIAGTLADAGFLTIRYDKRGIGQSGGRNETATLQDYAEDLRAVVKYLRNRKDVDRDRIAIAGHSEGGWVGMLAAAREKNNVAALVLLGTAGTTGAELVLEQQRHELDKVKTPAAERQEKIDLQRRIQRAVMTGRGWEDVPDALRKRADIPWFQSLLLYNPADVMDDVRQPVLIVSGALDRQVPPEHAERLAALARERKKPAPPVVRVLPGLNHLLVRAVTGEVEEYVLLPERSVSRDALSAIQEWLADVLQSPSRQIARSPNP